MKCALLPLCLILCSCDRDMDRQARVKPLGESDFFADGMGARPVPAHTVATTDATSDSPRSTGLKEGKYLESFPVTTEMMARGRERYGIYCGVCHGATGDGNGMVVQRGFPRPQPFREERLRQAPVGYIYEVIKNGYGAMHGYAGLVKTADRWAITAYVRALQLSQHSTEEDAPPDERKKLEEQRP